MTVLSCLRQALTYDSNPVKQSYRTLLDFFASRLRVDPHVPLSIPGAMLEYLEAALPDMLSDPLWSSPRIEDPLGCLAEELGVIPDQIVPGAVWDYLDVHALPSPRGHLPPLVLDRTCGVGRKLVGAYFLYGDQALYAGCEQHSTAFRIATCNMKLYDMSARILWSRHAFIDTSIGSHDWGWANQWTIPKMAVLGQRYIPDVERG